MVFRAQGRGGEGEVSCWGGCGAEIVGRSGSLAGKSGGGASVSPPPTSSIGGGGWGGGRVLNSKRDETESFGVEDLCQCQQLCTMDICFYPSALISPLEVLMIVVGHSRTQVA